MPHFKIATHDDRSIVRPIYSPTYFPWKVYRQLLKNRVFKNWYYTENLRALHISNNDIMVISGVVSFFPMQDPTIEVIKERSIDSYYLKWL